MELFKLFGRIAISNAEANTAVDETTGKAEDASGKIKNAFKKIGTAVATYFAVDKIVSFGKSCVNAASDVQEMENKFSVVFGDMSDEVDAWAENYAKSIGRNKTNIKTFLADNQNMFVGMGMTREEGAKLSEQMVTLGLDLASFNNLQEDDAVNALSKALMGETESAKRLGAVLNDNTLALAQEKLGYDGKFQSLTEAQKMEVRYQAILMQSADAVGDCERSMGSYKSTQIELNSATQTLRETIGVALLPAATALLGFFRDGIVLVSDFVTWLQEHEDIALLLGIAIGTLTAAIIAYNVAQNAAAITMALSTAATTALGAAVAFLTSPITLTIAAIGALIAIGVLLYKNWDTVREKAGIIFDKVSGVFQNLVDSVREKFDAVKRFISEPIEKAKELVGKAVDAIKGFFDFTFKWPKIPMPHFGIKPSGWKIGDLLKGSIPKLGIDWYAKGGIMTQPTLFDYNPMTGRAKVGGEAGAEAVAPISTLMQYIRTAVSDENKEVAGKLQRIIDLLEQFFPDVLAGADRQLVLDTGVLVAQTAPMMDAELGRLTIQKGRGR